MPRSAARQTVQINDRTPGSPLRATYVPDAGMIGVSLRDGDAELLGQRRGLQAYLELGKTMGIPFLHPWANRLSGPAYHAAGVGVDLQGGALGLRYDPNGLPMHGLLAASPEWGVEPPLVDGDQREELVASFDFSSPELLASFPYPHEIEIAVTLEDRRLQVQTTIIPTSDQAVPLAFGFHPYITLPGVPREDWQIELPALVHRPVDALGIPTGASAPAPAEAFTLGSRTFDDGYTGVAEGSQFVVAGGGRRVTVAFDEGYPAAQIFAPADDPVICFEPMAAPTNALVSGDGLRLAEPGHPAVATFSITVD